MPRVRSDQDGGGSSQATGDATGSGELLPPGIRARSLAEFYDAIEATGARKMVDAARGRCVTSLESRDAASAALRSYWIVYGDEIRGNPWDVLVALYFFWLGRFEFWCSAPEWIVAEANKKAPAASEDTAPAPGPSEALAKDRR